MDGKGQEEPKRFYDVERFRRIYLETANKSKGLRRIIGRASWHVSSMQGFIIGMMGFPLTIGMLAAVVAGVYYGPFAFLGLFGVLVGGLAFYAEKKVGRSLVFGDYNVWKRFLAQTLAFLLAVGLVFFLLLVSRLIPF